VRPAHDTDRRRRSTGPYKGSGTNSRGQLLRSKRFETGKHFARDPYNVRVSYKVSSRQESLIRRRQGTRSVWCNTIFTRSRTVAILCTVCAPNYNILLWDVRQNHFTLHVCVSRTFMFVRTRDEPTRFSFLRCTAYCWPTRGRVVASVAVTSGQTISRTRLD
jgi:hypothetical protein